jgi:hypothetical protein
MLLLGYKLLRWLVMSSFEGALWLGNKGKSWYVSKYATSAERSRAEESCPLECTKDVEAMHNVVFTSPIDSGVGTSASTANKFSWRYAGKFGGSRARATSLTLRTSKGEPDGYLMAGRMSTPKQAGSNGEEVVYADISFIPKATEVSGPMDRGNPEQVISGEGSVSREDLAGGWRLDKSGNSRLLLVKDRSCEELTWNDYRSAVFNSLGYEVSIKPPPKVIRLYREELRQLRYPEKVLIDGVWTLPEFPGII